MHSSSNWKFVPFDHNLLNSSVIGNLLYSLTIQLFGIILDIIIEDHHQSLAIVKSEKKRKLLLICQFRKFF